MSIRRTEANRKNGAKSRGPKTEAGKRISSGNSLKHGLTSQIVVLNTEDSAEYDQMRLEYHASLKPVGRVECDLVDEMAAAKWRQRRCCDLEARSIEIRMDQHDKNRFREPELPKDRPAHAFMSLSDEKCLGELSRYEGRHRRSYEKALKDLLTLQKLRRQAESNEEPAVETKKSQNEPNATGNPSPSKLAPPSPAPRNSPEPPPKLYNPPPNPSQPDDLPGATC